MRMTIGKHKGKPVDAMTNAYLLWLVTQDHIRFKHWELIKEALRILRQRFGNDFDAMVAEMEVKEPPPERWKRKLTPEQIAQREAEKAEKRRQLEEHRTAERLRRRAEWRAARDRADMERQLAAARQRLAAHRPATTMPETMIIDAGHYVRQARQNLRKPKIADDISDLI